MSLSLLPVIVLRKIADKSGRKGCGRGPPVKVIDRTVQVVRKSSPEATAGVIISGVSLAVGLVYM